MLLQQMQVVIIVHVPLALEKNITSVSKLEDPVIALTVLLVTVEVHLSKL
jgi:hypothetical protein